MSGALGLFCVSLPWSLAAMQIALGMVVLTAIIFHIKTRTFPFIATPFYFIIAVYLLIRWTMAAVSPTPLFSAKSVFLTDWVILSVPFLVTALSRCLSLKTILHILFASATLAGVYGCFQFVSGVEVFRGKSLTPMGNFYRAVGGYNFYLTFAANQLMAFALIFAFFIKETRWQISRWLYGFALLIILLSIIATFARSIWLALAIVVAVGVLQVNRRLFFYSIAGFAVFVLLAVLAFPEIQARLLSIFDLAQNEGRFNLWKTSWNMIKAHPLTGIGAGRFNLVFDSYQVPGFYDAFGHSHNDYLNTAVNSGVFAAFAWMAMWFYWCYSARKTYLTTTDPLQKRLLLGSLMGIIGILFAALFQCYYTDLENNIFWWFLAALGVWSHSDAVRRNDSVAMP